MKLTSVLVLLFLVSLNVFAQSKESSSRVRMNGDRDEGVSGFTAGLVYSNLSDFQVKDSSSTTRNGVKTEDKTETKNGGTHIGLYGLNLGYKNIYAWGPLGFSAGAQVLKGLNGTEFPSNITIYKILADVIFPVTDMFALSIGTNVSYLDGLAENSVTIDPAAGGQFGIEARFSQASILVGGQVLGINQKYSDSYYNGTGMTNYESKSEGFVSGVITQVSFTF